MFLGLYLDIFFGVMVEYPHNIRRTGLPNFKQLFLEQLHKLTHTRKKDVQFNSTEKGGLRENFSYTVKIHVVICHLGSIT